jgi:hypothetical protein
MALTTKPAGWKEALQRESDRASDPDYWIAIFTQRPEILHRLIADLFQAAHGVDRIPSVDDLWDLIAPPAYSNRPFGEAFEEILGSRDPAEIAEKAGLYRGTLSRYVRCVRPIVTSDVEGSMRRIELIARALDVHPSYFAEWRRLWVMALLDRAFQVRPELSYAMFQRLAGFERRTQNARSDRNHS